MNWSLSVAAPKDEARTVFTKALRWEEAYQAVPARTVLDQITEFAAQIARVAPEGVRVSLTTSGQVDPDGTGSCNVSLTFHASGT